MSNIVIDDELKNYMRPLREEEYEKLKESILAEGIRDPLVTWKGMLLDGYHRHKIAQEYGLEYETVEIDLPDKETAKEWIITNQLGRRNLTPQEASYYRGKLYESRKRQGARTDLTSPQNEEKLITAKELGKQYGVSKATIERDADFSEAVDKVAAEVGEEAKHAILTGKVNIPKKDVEKLIEVKQKAPELVDPILKSEITITDAKRAISREEKIRNIIEKAAEKKTINEMGVYPVLLADPPWRYDHPISDSRRIENQYPTMSIEEIINLDVPSITAYDAILFLWVTTPMLEKGLKVLNAWGFSYRTSMVWVKPSVGMGQWVRQRHELLLVGVKGNIPTPKGSNKPDSVIEAPREEHSKKPEIVYEIIERMYPELPKIELFSRNKRDGWEAWGFEV
jgi:N6-adenosine-specific RNA methylase IME4